MKAVTFGEIMLRLKTPEYLRIVQAQNFEASYGGAEANVAAGLAMLKEDAALVTKLPDNPVGQAALNELRRYGTDTTHILRGGKRLGIYYFEREIIFVLQMWCMTALTVHLPVQSQTNMTGIKFWKILIFSFSLE